MTPNDVKKLRIHGEIGTTPVSAVALRIERTLPCGIVPRQFFHSKKALQYRMFLQPIASHRQPGSGSNFAGT